MVDAADLPTEIGPVVEPERRVKEANLATLRNFAANRPGSKPMSLRFHFQAKPPGAPRRKFACTGEMLALLARL